MDNNTIGFTGGSMTYNSPTYTLPTLEVMVTSKCNMACTYCFEHHHDAKNIDMDKLIDRLRSSPPLSTIYIFGGEPLMAVDELQKFYDFIGSDDRIVENMQCLSSARHITTNGTLIPHSLEFIKANNMSVQISIDGSEDACVGRCFKGSQPAYDKIVESIDCCLDNDIPFTVHGVIHRENIQYLTESFWFFYDTYMKKSNNIDASIDMMSLNWAQIVFEDEWTDGDIDILLGQFQKVCDDIRAKEGLTEEQKLNLFKALCDYNKRGGHCGSGVNLSIINDTHILPCHRVNDVSKFDIGSFDNITPGNKRYWNSLNDISKKYKYMYSAMLERGQEPQTKHNWLYWCPLTNLETSNNIYYQSSKLSVVIYELNRFISWLSESYHK